MLKIAPNENNISMASFPPGDFNDDGVVQSSVFWNALGFGDGQTRAG